MQTKEDWPFGIAEKDLKKLMQDSGFHNVYNYEAAGQLWNFSKFYQLAVADKYEEQSKLIKQLFTFLDYTETSDSSGKEWHPIQVSCARAMMVGPLSECLAKLKETIK